MASIYSRAKTVRIWLGPGGGSEVETFLHAVEDGKVLELLISGEKKCVDGFKKVMSSSWWSRLWVLQEALLAKNAVVHFGDRSISWNVLFAALLLIYDHTTQAKSWEAGLHCLNGWSLHTLSCASRCFDNRHGLRSSRDVSHIIRFFSELSGLRVTDSRDRIYGSLGLLPVSLHISPDYVLSVLDVYRSFATRLIKWSKSLDSLTLCKIIDKETDWPSWVPDFRQESLFKPNLRPRRAAQLHASLTSAMVPN